MQNQLQTLADFDIEITLPPLFLKLPVEYGLAALEQMEAAAECGALPGFAGDPRGMGAHSDKDGNSCGLQHRLSATLI